MSRNTRLQSETLIIQNQAVPRSELQLSLDHTSQTLIYHVHVSYSKPGHSSSSIIVDEHVQASYISNIQQDSLTCHKALTQESTECRHTRQGSDLKALSLCRLCVVTILRRSLQSFVPSSAPRRSPDLPSRSHLHYKRREQTVLQSSVDLTILPWRFRSC